MRLRNRIWRSRSKPLPTFEEFGEPVNDKFREQYTGMVAELFFANEGELVHKWLHYLPIYDQLLSGRVG